MYKLTTWLYSTQHIQYELSGLYVDRYDLTLHRKSYFIVVGHDQLLYKYAYM